MASKRWRWWWVLVGSLTTGVCGAAALLAQEVNMPAPLRLIAGLTLGAVCWMVLTIVYSWAWEWIEGGEE